MMIRFGDDEEHESRYVLLEVFEHGDADDDWDDALTELDMLKMLAEKLGYNLIANPDRSL